MWITRVSIGCRGDAVRRPGTVVHAGPTSPNRSARVHRTQWATHRVAPTSPRVQVRALRQQRPGAPGVPVVGAVREPPLQHAMLQRIPWWNRLGPPPARPSCHFPVVRCLHIMFKRRAMWFPVDQKHAMMVATAALC
jgi:hypothetical protein